MAEIVWWGILISLFLLVAIFMILSGQIKTAKSGEVLHLFDTHGSRKKSVLGPKNVFILREKAQLVRIGQHLTAEYTTPSGQKLEIVFKGEDGFEHVAAEFGINWKESTKQLVTKRARELRYIDILLASSRVEIEEILLEFKNLLNDHPNLLNLGLTIESVGYSPYISSNEAEYRVITNHPNPIQ